MRRPITKPKAITADGRVLITWYKTTPFFSDARADEFSTFRVCRKREDRFTFGEDGEEFFLGGRAGNAEVVFEGPLRAHNKRKYTFVDAGVEAGNTYSYFVQTKNSAPIGPAPVKVRDPRVWWPYRKIMSRLEALADAAPELVRLTACGTTGAGRSIPRVQVGTGRRVLGLVGMIHGGESGPELIIPALERLSREATSLLRKTAIVAVPVVNIDAREQMVQGVPWYLRTTPQGVDLNRNFPAGWENVEYGYGLDSSDPDSVTYRGPLAGSTPETQAVMSAFVETRPYAVLSFHWLASICEMPGFAARAGTDDADYMERCRHIMQAYAGGLYPGRSYRKGWCSFQTTAGSLPTWFYEQGGIPAFDLEGGTSPEAKPGLTDRTDPDLLEDFQERHRRAIEKVLQAAAD